MVKVKFRVYVEKLCHRCKQVHQLPTHRVLFMVDEGDPTTAIQRTHAKAVALLETESDKLRPLFQRMIEVSK